LLLAVTYWFLTKFSKDYTANSKADLVYLEIPENTILTEDYPKELDFQITASGFDILYTKFKNIKVEIALDKFYKNGAENITIPESELSKLISKELTSGITLKKVGRSSLVINLDGIVSKSVPVFSNVKIKFKDGFLALDSLIILPDSVRVSGPAAVLRDITSVETVLFSLENIENDIEEIVPLIKPPSKKINIEPTSVEVAMDVAEFSQKSVVLPVNVINLPKNINIKLIPANVTITFNVSVEEFNSLNENDFKLICDFSERNGEENFMIPKLTTKPNFIKNIEFETKKIDYLIFK